MFTLWYADQILANSGAANFTGTSTFTFSQTGNFVAGSVTGNANFAGTSTLTFSQTGVFNAFASMAGTATATFGQSGSLNLGSGFNGASTTSFGQSGTLAATSSFGGTSATLFAQSGAFVAGAAAGNAVFVGSSTIIFGQSGNFVAQQIQTNPNPGTDAWGPSGYYFKPKAKPARETLDEAITESVELVSRETYRVTPQQIARIAAAMVKREPLQTLDFEALQVKADKLHDAIQSAIAEAQSRKEIEKQIAQFAIVKAYILDMQAQDDDAAWLLLAA